MNGGIGMREKRVLNFGSLNLDYVYRVDHFVRPGETLSADARVVKYGGKGLNQSVALARAGVRAAHAGCVGAGGEGLRALLDGEGVDTSKLVAVEEMQGHTVIQVNREGENCILLYGGSNQCVTPEQIAATLADCAAGDWLVLQNEINNLPAIVDAAFEKGMVIDAFVMSPQAAGSWNPDRVVRLVDWAREHYAVDTNRIYLIGMSLGGYGTLDVAGTYPDRFAAAMALCGGSTLKEHCGLNRLPLWILHGTADRAVGISASQRVVDAMRSCDTASRLLWTPLKGASHGRLARIFYLPQTYDWLFAHSLADSSRTLCRDFDITMDDLSGKDVYRAVRSGGNKVVRMQGTTGTQEDVAKGAEEFHTVKRGDTLSAIARKNHTTVKKLCRLNGIKASAKLQPGQRLRVR